MPNRSELAAAASSQHPESVQALAEVVGAITDRLVVAPSITFVALTGRFLLAEVELGLAIHNLLQSEHTVCFTAHTAAGGGRILDPAASLAVLALAEIDVNFSDFSDLSDFSAGEEVSGRRMGAGTNVGFAKAGASRPGVTLTFDAHDGLMPVHLYEGETKRRSSRLVATLGADNPVITASVGACPIGLPCPVTSIEGRRLLSLDGEAVRSLIVDRLEVEDHDLGGPTVDLPRIMVEIVNSSTPERFVAVVDANPDDQSITLARPVAAGEIVQLLRHSPAMAVDEVVSRQLRRQPGDPQAVMVLSNLPGGPDGHLVSTASADLSPQLLGIFGPAPVGPGLPWPEVSVLTLR